MQRGISKKRGGSKQTEKGEARPTVTLKNKSMRKKTLSEIVTEQMEDDASRNGRLGGSRITFEDDDGGVVEDYEEIHEEEENASKGYSDIIKKKRQRETSSSSASLRRRGPLDPELSTGKYAATPVSVEAAMDQLFSGFDTGDLQDEINDFADLEDDDDEEADEMEASSEDEAETKPKKRKRVKDLSEADYIKYLEKKEKAKPQVSLTVEDDIHTQLEELRAQQIQLLHRQGKKGAPEENLGQRQAKIQESVKYFIALYAQLLRVRVKLQPAVLSGVALPQYYALPLFSVKGLECVLKDLESTTKEEEIKTLKSTLKTSQSNLKDVQKKLREVLDSLYKDGLSFLHSGDAPPLKKTRIEPESSGSPLSIDALQSFQRDVRERANICLTFWGNRLALKPTAASGSSAGGDLHAIHQPLPVQIEALLQSKTRLRAKVQKNRSHLSILAHPEHLRASRWLMVGEADQKITPESSTALEAGKAARALHVAEGDIDDEIFDDGDFLRELVRRGGTVALHLEQQLKEDRDTALKQHGSELSVGSRKGLHRLTKGKALDFKPRAKLVGFMVAEPWEHSLPARNDIIIRSMFQ